MSYSILILFWIVTYLIGSIPFGLVLAKIFGQTDIRNHGSKNIGATNVTRVLGKKLGLATLILDALKGATMVVIAQISFGNYSAEILERIMAITALIAVIGHIFPIYLKFKGGKGVATTIAVILAINPILGAICIFTWIATFFATRISAVSSLTATISIAIISFFSKSDISQPLVLTFLAILILIRHKENLIRLKNGQEHKI